ncbi:MAG: hypothetical protein Q4C08_01125 [Pseudomonadota bacterium]|nr:hypothetical protein [Pseudomonadota bacterium]
MRVNYKTLLHFLIISCITFSDALAAKPLSNYGNIQTVQNYSSNPFWTPDAPYNQRMPTPVYATGTDIGTAECQQITANLVAAQCMTRNNCVSTRLSDIRPALMMQLTNMPGGNYGTACAGYLDSAFNDYVKKHGHAGTNVAGATFPAPSIPNPNANANQPQINTNNAFPQPKPEWMVEQEMRKQELQALKAASGTPPVGIDPNAAFPTTYADLSFSERMANAKEGYEPFKDSSAFKTISVETEQEYLARRQEVLALKNKYQQMRDSYELTPEEYCKKYPEHERCKEQEQEKQTREQLMQKIADALKEAKK